MGNNRTFKPANNNYDTHYRPSIIGKIAIAIALPAVVTGFFAMILGMIMQKWMGNCFAVGIVAELIAVLAGFFIVIDIVVFNNRYKKNNLKNRQASSLGKNAGKANAFKPKKEKDIMDLVRFLVGLGLGILLGYLIWGVN